MGKSARDEDAVVGFETVLQSARNNFGGNLFAKEPSAHDFGGTQVFEALEWLPTFVLIHCAV